MASRSRLRPDFNPELEFRQGSPIDLETLEAIDLERFQHVIFLADESLDAQRADARILVTLLHLRDIADRRGAQFTIVSEMIDERNRHWPRPHSTRATESSSSPSTRGRRADFGKYRPVFGPSAGFA